MPRWTHPNITAAMLIAGFATFAQPQLAVAATPKAQQVDAAQARELERELKQIRHRYFRASRNAELHAIGLEKLREIANDPRSFLQMLHVFGDEPDPIRNAVYTLVAESDDPLADTALAERAVFDRNDAHRAALLEILVDRYTDRPVPSAVDVVIAAGLQRERDETVAAAAGLAESLNIVRAIPLIAASQVRGGVNRETRGAIAQIYVARQRTFVSDLQPVVGDGAVGFDPELSVVSEGTVLRVFDAHVVTYRTEVHGALRRLAAHAAGEEVPDFGWMPGPWIAWYDKTVAPTLDDTAQGDG